MRMTVTVTMDVDPAEYDYRMAGAVLAKGGDTVGFIREVVARGLEHVLDNEDDPTRPRRRPIIVESVVAEREG